MPPKSSKLCQSFSDIMQQTSSMLEYFIQYMESVGALHLVQFWLTVESFKAQNRSQARTPQLGENDRHLKSDKVINGSPLLTSCSKCDAHTRSLTETTTTEAASLSEPGEEVGSRGGKHRGLQRRDTENHKYCNCGIGMHQHTTPPLTPNQKSRTDMAPLPLKDNSTSVSKKGRPQREYPSPRLKRSNPSADVLASMDLPPDLLSSKDGVLKRNLIQAGSPSDVVSPPENQLGSGNLIPNARTPPRDLPPGLKRLSPSPKDLIPVHFGSDGHPVLGTDALEIYSKYLALNATDQVEVTDEIRQRVEVSICPEDGIISDCCFAEAQAFVYEVMEKRYYPGFLRSSYLCKYQLEYIASGGLNLIDFLLEENALSFFIEFMEQESASPLLQFWLTAENYYNQLSSPDHNADMEVDMSDAIAIYNRYFSLQATAPLNMEDSVRLDVENRICDEHGPRADSYLRPQLVAFHTMNEVYFPVFIGSSIYLRFLNELVHMLNKDDDDDMAAEREIASRTGSGKSSNRTALKLGHTVMGKDLDDPDSLWERPAFLLRLGFVNEFGEYVSEIDPTPIKSSKKEYSWTVSARILKKHRKEEDLAMKLAKNIIRQVMNSVTSDDRSNQAAN